MRKVLSDIRVQAAVLVVVVLLATARINDPTPEAYAASTATTSTKTIPGDWVYLGDDIVTDCSSSQTLAASTTIPDGTRLIIVQAQGGNLRYRVASATAPTATAGGIIATNGYLTVMGGFSAFAFIEESGADAYLIFAK